MGMLCCHFPRKMQWKMWLSLLKVATQCGKKEVKISLRSHKAICPKVLRSCHTRLIQIPAASLPWSTFLSSIFFHNYAHWAVAAFSESDATVPTTLASLPTLMDCLSMYFLLQTVVVVGQNTCNIKIINIAEKCLETFLYIRLCSSSLNNRVR